MKLDEPLGETLQMWTKIFMRHSMQDFVLFSKENKLSTTHLGALGFIERKGADGVSQIGEHLGISKAAASQLLEKLVQDGLVSRMEDPNDRRQKRIALTDKGRQFLQKGMRARMKWLQDLAATMSPDEQEQVLAALKLMIEKATLLEQNRKPES